MTWKAEQMRDQMKRIGTMTCRAEQMSDQMVCVCGNSWDIGDIFLPECRATPTPNADRPDSGTTGTCNPTTGRARGFEPHPELVKLANGGVSDGSTAIYYQLPEGSEQLQDLISYRNMNGQIAEIFRSCYRYGRASHSDQLRDAKKIAFYAQAEVERLEKYGSED